ncbi:MAG: DUF3604 domain-containing protein [Myxococcota bacterium]
MTTSSPVQATWIHEVATGHYATEPHIALDHEDHIWLAWTDRAPYTQGGHETIQVARLGCWQTMDHWPTSPEPQSISEASSVATWPTLTHNPHDHHMQATWVGLYAFGHAELITCDITAQTPPRRLWQANSIRDPTTAVAYDGTLWFACATTQHGRHTVVVGCVSPDGTLSTTELDPSSGHLRQRPTLAITSEGEALVAWESYDHATIRLCGAHLTANGACQPTGIWREAAHHFNQAPALALVDGHTPWLAWATDRRTADTPPDLARWVRLGRWNRTTHHLSAEPDPTGVDLEARGEDQSLEFPAIAAMPGGGLWIAARASHNYRLLTFHGDRWGEPIELGDVLWGCRGTRMGLIPVAPQTAVVACHDRRGLTLRRVHADDHWTSNASHERTTPSAPLIPLGSPASSTPPKESPTQWDSPSGSVQAFWGDIHFHSALSDGVGTVSEAYLRCRDRYGHDFACLTDHDGFIGRRVTDGVWRRMVEAAEHFNRPEEGFATLIGIEYTGPRYPGPGHKCLYFDGHQAPLVCRRDGLEAPEDLLARVEALGGLAIPHHVGWLGGDPEHHTPTLQPCWEICSTHGQYEAERHEADAPPIGYREGLEEHQNVLRSHMIRRQLEAGQRFGFVGGSDGHGLLWHHGISRQRDSHRTGLTGVWLQALGRRAIMDALRARRTWATSGARMALGFSIEGHWMGSILPGPPQGTLQVKVYCSASEPLRELAVLGHTTDGIRIMAHADGAVGQPTWRGTIPIQSADMVPQRPLVYVRAVGSGGDVAWASPIFWR